MTASSQPAAPKRGMMDFKRSWSNTPKLPKDAMKRQGAITQLAFQLLGGRDGAMAFLNGDNAALKGRPLDLATASEEGYTSVEAAIRQLAGAAG
ncbi:MAG: hypothetical protein H6R45_571 [Proteobacteria bacterium]|nr:hypothetical protein [Pseudomonadota bacterium]